MPEDSVALAFPSEGVEPQETPDSDGIYSVYPPNNPDFHNWTTKDKIKSVGNYVALQVHGLDTFDRTGEIIHLPDHIRRRVDGYDRVNNELYRRVSSPQAQEELGKIADRFVRPEKDRIPTNISELRHGERVIVFDFDGTISDPSERTGEFDEFLPGSYPLDSYLGEDRSRFKYAAAHWEDVMVEEGSLFKEGAANTKLRVGMKELIEKALTSGNIKICILTANFQPFMEEIVNRFEGGDKIRVECIKPGDISSVEKANKLKEIALENPNATLEYVGDSKTDFVTRKAAEIVGVFHTVEGLPFDKSLSDAGVEHMTFSDGFELASNLDLPLAA